MSKTAERPRRRQYLINPSFQLSFLGYMLGLTGASIAIFYAANRYFFWRFQSLGETLQLPAGHPYFQFLAKQASTMNVIFLITALVVLAVLLTWGLMLSHRIAGPIYRICKDLKAAKETGDLKPIQMREKDYFQELGTALNHVVTLRGGPSK